MRSALVLGLLALGGCGAPERVDLRRLDEDDRRFVAPAPREEGKDLLKKEELSLDEVLAVADLLNPTLATERKNVDLATAALWEAGIYPNPSLFFEVEDYRTGDGATVGKMKRTAGIRIPLVVSGRIGAAMAAADKEREISALQYVWRRREILTDVKRGFVRVLASRRNVDLAKETRMIALSFRDVTNERFKAQAIPEMELLKAEVSLAKADIDLKLAEKELAVAIKALQALMGDAEFPNEKFKGDLFARFAIPSMEVLRGQVMVAHPVLEIAKRNRETAELDLVRVERERFPDIGLALSGGRDADGDAILEGGLEIPLPLFNRNQARIAAAEVRVRKAELAIQSARNDLLLRLAEAYRSFTAAQERVTVYQEEIVPKARKALDQTNEGYRLGKFGYLDLLDAQRTLAEARFALAAGLAELNLAAAELEKLTGSKLEPIR